jgi:membrane protein implicated in regulation of membrane protease activity
MDRLGRWTVAALVTVATFAAATWIGGAVVLPPMLEDVAIRWGLASALGSTLAALAAVWGHGFATRATRTTGQMLPQNSAQASAARAVAVAGGNSGSISTGDSSPAALPQPPTTQPSTALSARSVSACGERSIAVGGENSGTVSTGDQSGDATP